VLKVGSGPKEFGALPNVSYKIGAKIGHFSEVLTISLVVLDDFPDFRAISSLLFSLAKNVLKSRIFGPSKPDLRYKKNRFF